MTPKEIEEFKKETKEHLTNLASKLEKNIDESISVSLKKIENTITKMNKQIFDYEKEIQKLNEINHTIEQTLTNVLLAIRQNEYLQAWYPAQQGHPEMKVVGKHPLSPDWSKPESEARPK